MRHTTLIAGLALALLVALFWALPSFGQESTATAPPPSLTPEIFTSTATAWITAIGTVATLALTAVATLWAKYQDIKARQDRQAEKTGAMQKQITEIALKTPAGPPQNGALALALIPLFFLSGCAVSRDMTTGETRMEARLSLEDALRIAESFRPRPATTGYAK